MSAETNNEGFRAEMLKEIKEIQEEIAELREAEREISEAKSKSEKNSRKAAIKRVSTVSKER